MLFIRANDLNLSPPCKSQIHCLGHCRNANCSVCETFSCPCWLSAVPTSVMSETMTKKNTLGGSQTQTVLLVYPVFPQTNGWGTGGRPQAQHMALGRSFVWAVCVPWKNGIVARVNQTRHRGVCQGKSESRRGPWPRELLVASPTDLCVIRTRPHSMILGSLSVSAIVARSLIFRFSLTQVRMHK